MTLNEFFNILKDIWLWSPLLLSFFVLFAFLGQYFFKSEAKIMGYSLFFISSLFLFPVLRFFILRIHQPFSGGQDSATVSIVIGIMALVLTFISGIVIFVLYRAKDDIEKQIKTMKKFTDKQSFQISRNTLKIAIDEQISEIEEALDEDGDDSLELDLLPLESLKTFYYARSPEKIISSIMLMQKYHKARALISPEGWQYIAALPKQLNYDDPKLKKEVFAILRMRH